MGGGREGKERGNHAVLIHLSSLSTLVGSSGGFPGLAALWEEERGRRGVLGNDTPLTPPPSPPRTPTGVLPNEARLRIEFDEVVQERLRLRFAISSIY